MRDPTTLLLTEIDTQVTLRNGTNVIRKILNLTKSRDTRHRRLSKRVRKMLSESLSGIDAELEILNVSQRKISDLVVKTEKCQSCTAADCKGCGELKGLRTLGLLEG